MERRYNTRSPAVKRLMREAQELSEPTDQYFAQPLEDNLFEWHFTVRGPADSDFQNGIYHGRIILPVDYPMKPPSIMWLTPNGRFETNKKICLSISGHHPESWQPSWSIRTALLAIIGFMPTHPGGAIGSLDYKPEERKLLAKKSREWQCPSCADIQSILLEPSAESNNTSDEVRELASQIDFQGEKSKSKEDECPIETAAMCTYPTAVSVASSESSTIIAQSIQTKVATSTEQTNVCHHPPAYSAHITPWMYPPEMINPSPGMMVPPIGAATHHPWALETTGSLASIMPQFPYPPNHYSTNYISPFYSPVFALHTRLGLFPFPITSGQTPVTSGTAVNNPNSAPVTGGTAINNPNSASVTGGTAINNSNSAPVTGGTAVNNSNSATGGTAVNSPSSEPVTGGTAVISPSSEPVTGGTAVNSPSSAPVTGGIAMNNPSSEPVTGGTAVNSPSSAPVTGGTAVNSTSSAPVTGGTAVNSPSSAPVTGGTAVNSPSSAPVTGGTAVNSPSSAPVTGGTAVNSPSSAPVTGGIAVNSPSSAPVTGGTAVNSPSSSLTHSGSHQTSTSVSSFPINQTTTHTPITTPKPTSRPLYVNSSKLTVHHKTQSELSHSENQAGSNMMDELLTKVKRVGSDNNSMSTLVQEEAGAVGGAPVTVDQAFSAVGDSESVKIVELKAADSISEISVSFKRDSVMDMTETNNSGLDADDNSIISDTENRSGLERSISGSTSDLERRRHRQEDTKAGLHQRPSAAARIPSDIPDYPNERRRSHGARHRIEAASGDTRPRNRDNLNQAINNINVRQNYQGVLNEMRERNSPYDLTFFVMIVLSVSTVIILFNRIAQKIDWAEMYDTDSEF